MRYKEYKKVDLPWIEEIPSHWEVNNFKKFVDMYTGNSIPDNEKNNYIYTENSRPYISTKDISKDNNYVNYNNGMCIKIDNLRFKVAKKDSTLVCIEGGSGGEKVAYVIKDVSFVNKLCCIKSSCEIINDKFIYYFVKSNLFKYQYYLNVTGDRNGVSLQKIRYFQILIPPKEEQEQIARFLDWKINEIDRLIEIYIKKISRLNDLKDLMISNYIFNGINRNIKFKKVGLSYIDQIPENWELEKIKFNFEIVKSIAGKEGYNVLSITQQGITIKDISKNEGQMASDYSKYQFVEVGDFAMNHMDLLTGYIDISKYFGVTSPDYRVFRIKNKLKIYDKYYLLMFQYFYKSRIFYKLGQGASHMGRWRLPADNFLNMKIPVPSYKDQVKIVDSINSKSDILNHQIERLKSIVFSLKNLKQSLISDAITGRIDVRNVHIPNYEKDDDIEDDAVLEENFEEEEV